jgi:hypothetical protein
VVFLWVFRHDLVGLLALELFHAGLDVRTLTKKIGKRTVKVTYYISIVHAPIVGRHVRRVGMLVRFRVDREVEIYCTAGRSSHRESARMVIRLTKLRYIGQLPVGLMQLIVSGVPDDRVRNVHVRRVSMAWLRRLHKWRRMEVIFRLRGDYELRLADGTHFNV